MVNVCSCNHGCASVPLPRSKLRPGTRVPVTKGPLEAKELLVIETNDATGTRVLALSDRGVDHPCALPTERALMGYLCEEKKSGPVPANACAKGCD
jgi:hypothetical protein